MKRNSIQGIGERLQKLATKPPMWPSPEQADTSLLLQEFHLEWTLHYFVALQTMTVAHAALTSWYIDSPRTNDHKDKLISLAALSIDSATCALEADRIEQFLDLSLSIIKSASKILLLVPITAVFEVGGALSEIQKLIKSGKSPLLGLNELVPLAEASMERMLFMSLWVDSQVSAITNSRAAANQTASIAELKRPIVARLLALRQGCIANGITPTRMLPSTEGLWPVGLR